MKPPTFLTLLAAAVTLAAAPIPVGVVTVVAPTPLLGSGIDQAALPAATTVLGPAEIDRTDITSLTRAILDTLPSASLNDTAGNPFQPDILFRGFTASPVAGTAQGLAVYVNGARFNDPFGDTVNWDLIPPIAIRTVNIEGSNPVFGLNALGGSVNVQMKTGFDVHGADLTAYGGSYGRAAGVLQYGHQAGDTALYIAADLTHDGGYRQTQASDLHRLYADLGWRGTEAELHLSLDAADNRLGNPGASPVQELDADPSGIFTGPNTVTNQYVALTLNGSYAVSDSTSLQALAYLQTLTQRVTNGATSDAQACGNGVDAICNSDGTELTTAGGATVPDFLPGAPYSALVREGLDTQAAGASLQLTTETPLLAHPNHLVAGASLDAASATFNAQTLIGGFTTDGSQLFVGPPDIVEVQPDEGVQPVKLTTTTRTAGVFLADLLTLAPHLDLSLDARLNNAEIDLADRLGTALTGQHGYTRLNPGAGLTYAALPGLTLYASYAQANRAPTPTELSCASAATPCSLLNFFIGDPSLKQVVARTIEAGLRHPGQPFAAGTLAWTLDAFRTDDTDDLIFESARDNPNLAFYTNAGRTRRQGIEATLRYTTPRLSARLGATYTDATFRSPLLINTASNPAADARGNEQVRPGDRIPGIPAWRGTAVLDYRLTDRWTLGAATTLSGPQYRFGDEANQAKPVGGYVTIDLDTAYRLTDHLTLFGVIDNLTDRRYAAYGTFGPVDAVPFPRVAGGVADPRTASPGQPISLYGGVRAAF